VANRQRFAIEAQAAAHIRHPNVVRIFDYGVDDAIGPYLVMELLEGPTLAAIGDAGRLPLASARSRCSPGCARRSRPATAAASSTATSSRPT
jgi:serine/threonine protein kinase